MTEYSSWNVSGHVLVLSRSLRIWALSRQFIRVHLPVEMTNDVLNIANSFVVAPSSRCSIVLFLGESVLELFKIFYRPNGFVTCVHSYENLNWNPVVTFTETLHRSLRMSYLCQKGIARFTFCPFGHYTGQKLHYTAG